jgi:hypothetical protein
MIFGWTKTQQQLQKERASQLQLPSITQRGEWGVAHLAVIEDSYNTIEVNTTKKTKLEELRRFKL